MTSAQRLREADVIHGFWSVTGDPTVIDAAASVAPDFICVDTQHGVDLARVDPTLFTTMASYGVAGMVRVESLDLGRIGRALDLGAAGIVVPLISSAAQAETVVEATRHAPRGGRSYGMQTRRVGPFDEPPFIVIQVETAGAVEEIDEIAAVDGVDALYIGPADLGLGLGGAPAPDVNEVFDGTHDDAGVLQQAFRSVVEAARSKDVIAGLHCGNGTSASRAIAEGFTMTSVAADVGLIATGLEEQLRAARG